MGVPEISRRLIGGVWRTSEREESSGPGGSQTLAQVLSTGNDAGGAQAKNLADGTDPQDAATVSQLGAGGGPDVSEDGTTGLVQQPDLIEFPGATVDEPVPGVARVTLGGSQPFNIVRFPFAWDTPGLQVEAFPITGVTVLTKTLTIAGDHTAVLPAGASFNIAGSSMNDGTYTVDTSSFGAGSTTIVTVEAIPDGTVDGNVIDLFTAGVVVYTPAADDVLWIGSYISLPDATPFNGTDPTVAVCPQGNDAQNDDFITGNTTDSALGVSDWDIIDARASDPFVSRGTTPIIVVLLAAGGGAPGATTGAGEVVLLIAPAAP